MEQTAEPTQAEVWQLFKEFAIGFKELKENSKETDVKFKETDTKFKETEEMFKEVAARFKETDAKIKESDIKFKASLDATFRRMEANFTSQWGKLVEALVTPAVVQEFQARGIQVYYTSRRLERRIDGEKMEIDVLLENTVEIVVISVKSTMKVAHVDEFLEDLSQLDKFFPKYKKMRVYGAVADLTYDEESDRYAYKKGLFVLGMIGEGMIQIQNDPKFRPRNFGSTPDKTIDEFNKALQAAI